MAVRSDLLLAPALTGSGGSGLDPRPGNTSFPAIWPGTKGPGQQEITKNDPLHAAMRGRPWV